MLFILTVTYTVQIYITGTYEDVFSLTVSIEGGERQRTENQLLTDPTRETQGYDV